MAIEYKWSVAGMKCYPEYEGFENVVFTVHWHLLAKDGENSASNYGSVKLKLDPNHEYIPYDQLTEEQVIGWVKGTMNQNSNPMSPSAEEYELKLAEEIEKKKRPPEVTPPLPWSN